MNDRRGSSPTGGDGGASVPYERPECRSDRAVAWARGGAQGFASTRGARAISTWRAPQQSGGGSRIGAARSSHSVTALAAVRMAHVKASDPGYTKPAQTASPGRRRR